MKVEFNRGYTVYKNSNPDLVIAAPHCGPALEVTTSRDDNSETVASLCWKKMGGTLIVSSMPRKRLWGVDFNRDIPSLKTALGAFKIFFEEKDVDKMHDYRKKYAWVALDEPDYYNRLRIYQNFWEEVSKGECILLIHRTFSRIKAVPSIMDIVTFSEWGVKENLIKEIVQEINAKYFDFFQKVEKDYKQAVSFETKRVISDILRIYGSLQPEKIAIEFKENIERDLENIKKYAKPAVVNQLEKEFTPHHFIEAVESALENSPTPEVTMNNVYNGALALGPKRKLFPNKGKVVIEVEPNGFINFWHPHIAADIINDIVNMIRK